MMKKYRYCSMGLEAPVIAGEVFSRQTQAVFVLKALFFIAYICKTVRLMQDGKCQELQQGLYLYGS